jgi:phage terminase small subunit
MTKRTRSSCKNSYRPLTERQRAFVISWLENGGNGTQAALFAYGCSTPAAAAVTASRLLRNVNVKRVIEAEMAEAGLPLGRIIQIAMNRLLAEPTLKRQLKGVEIFLKLIG